MSKNCKALSCPFLCLRRLPFTCRCSIDAVLVSIDVESETREHNIITEIGLSILDARAIRARSTDAGLCEWMTTLQCTHLRIEDSGKKIARVHDRHGRPLWASRDFTFGRSKWTNLGAARHVLKDLLCIADDRDSSAREPPKYRNVIVVGHAWSNEDAYLRKLGDGFTLKSIGTVVAVVDTQIMNCDGCDLPSLSTLLYDIDISPENLHNGGNDAAYTTVACVGNEIKRLKQQGLILSTGVGMTAKSAIERLEEKGKQIQEACPLDPHRCDICGMRNHPRDECYSMTRCTACGKVGHPRNNCRWLTCGECHEPGHIKERCPRYRKKNAPLSNQGHPRGSVAAAKALAGSPERVFSGSLADISSFPGTAISTIPTVRTPTVTLDMQDPTVAMSTTGRMDSPKKQPTRKKGKRYQPIESWF